MNVAAAKPNRPRMDGAAIGCRNTRVWSRHSRSSLAAPLVAPRDAGCVPVLIRYLHSLKSLGALRWLEARERSWIASILTWLVARVGRAASARSSWPDRPPARCSAHD